MGGSGSPFIEDVSQLEEAVEDASADVIEISGAIKWFDAAKGYGFIVPDNGMADILLHVTVLRRDGHQTAHEGARVVCQVLRQSKGLQAFRILEMDNSTAIHPSQWFIARGRFHLERLELRRSDRLGLPAEHLLARGRRRLVVFA